MILVSSVYRVSITCIKQMAYAYIDLECADQDSHTSSMELGHEDLSSSGEIGSRKAVRSIQMKVVMRIRSKPIVILEY